MRQLIIKMFARMLGIELNFNRKFYHVDGFSDTTDFINWRNGVTHTVSVDGVWRKSHCDIDWLEQCVKDGVYEEVS